MALGIPTIATNIGNISNIIDNNIDGLLVQNTNDDWYKALDSLINNVDFRKKIGINAKSKITNNYTSEIIKIKYLEIISK